MRLVHIVLEGFSVSFDEADSELIQEMQTLLSNAGCIVPESNGEWSVNFVAAIAVFCAIHNITTQGVSPRLAAELLEYR